LRALPLRCAALARQGIDFLLIREKDLAAGTLVQLCREIAGVVREQRSQTRILVAARLDVALAAGLDGVHLASHPEELCPAQVRDLYWRANLPAPFVSISCHSLEDIRRARLAHASAALFAPVFGKSVAGEQVCPPDGLDPLRAACAGAASMPVFALGGVTRENAPDCLRAGAAGVAGIRLFMADKSL
jgi:thiamine-phosphate pyrophosphorylase